MRARTLVSIVALILMTATVGPAPADGAMQAPPAPPRGIDRLLRLPIGAVSAPATNAGGTWVRSFGTPAEDFFSMIRQTDDGGYVFGGSTGDAGSAMAVILFRTDASGAVQWAKRYTQGDLSGAEILPTSDGGYVVSGMTSAGPGVGEMWVAKLDASGGIVWQKAYGTFSLGFGLAVPLDDGGFVITGLDFSMTSFTLAMHVLRLDSSGNIQWQKEITGGTEDFYFGYPIPQADGSYMVVGWRSDMDGDDAQGWLLKLSSAGAVEWQKLFQGSGYDVFFAALATGDGGTLVQGTTSSFAAGGSDDSDLWLLKLNGAGNVVWQKAYGGPDDDYGGVTPVGTGYLVGGQTESYGAGGLDAWLAMLDGSGNLQWSRTYGGPADDAGWAYADATGDGYLLVGATASFGAGNEDGWLIKVNDSGNLEWQRTYGGADDDDLYFARRVDAISPRAWYPQLVRTGFDLLTPTLIDADEIFVEGDTRSFGAGSGDLWAGQVDASGGVGGSCAFIGTSNATVRSQTVGVSTTTATVSTGTAPVSNGARQAQAISVAVTTTSVDVTDLCDATPMLSATASASPSTGPAPLTVSFAGSASNGTSPYTWDWDFGDGSAHSGSRNPTHTYTDVGFYTATLTVGDDAGDTASDSVEITVTTGGGEYTAFIPGIAHAEGAMGSEWRSDVAIVNPDTAPASLILTYVPYDGGAPIVREHTIAAGVTREWRDILVGLFGLAPSASAKGTLQIRSSVPVEASARTYNQSALGTFGQYLPAVDETQVLREADEGVIPLLKSNAGFRSNLGILNIGSSSCETTVQLYGTSGGQLGRSLHYNVPPGEYVQENGILEEAGAGAQDIVYAVVRVDSVGGRAWAFGSVVDNGTNDPTTVPATVGPAALQQAVAGIAHAEGSMASVWRSNLAAVNPGTRQAQLVLTYAPYGGGTPIARTHTLAPGATHEWQDLLVSLFGLSPSASVKGTVQVTSTAPVHASARTYNQGADGTFGQYLPAIAATGALNPGERGIIPQLKASEGFRSNLGILNAGLTPVTVEVRLYGASGAQAGSTITRTVPVGQYWQQNNVFDEVGAGNQSIAYATVEVMSANGLAWAFGSVVDNGTNDPTTMPLLLP